MVHIIIIKITKLNRINVWNLSANTQLYWIEQIKPISRLFRYRTKSVVFNHLHSIHSEFHTLTFYSQTHKKTFFEYRDSRRIDKVFVILQANWCCYSGKLCGAVIELPLSQNSNECFEIHQQKLLNFEYIAANITIFLQHEHQMKIKYHIIYNNN